MTCSTCRYWRDSECHRHAPVRDIARGHVLRLWPETAPDDWCGDHARPHGSLVEAVASRLDHGDA